MTPLDRLYLSRAVELARRALGDTSPNPPVGAVVVRDGALLGEGYHHRAGEAHAEVVALRAAGDAAGATLYVSLEPCNHVGRTPACTQAIVDAKIARVVIGVEDPNPKTNGGGIARLRDAGVRVEIAHDAAAQAVQDVFARAIRLDRPYLALKMAMSLDGYITSQPGVQEWLTSEAERDYVREMRIVHDAVMVGAGTIRIDDSQLTVRPPHARRLPYRRVIACERDAVPPASRAFEAVDGYAKTIVLAPSGLRDRFAGVEHVADVIFVGTADAIVLDLPMAMRALRERGVQSVLCEGGPTLAGHLLRADVVDRLYWAVAPRFLGNPLAVPVVGAGGAWSSARELHFERSERVGSDVMITGVFADV